MLIWLTSKDEFKFSSPTVFLLLMTLLFELPCRTALLEDRVEATPFLLRLEDEILSCLFTDWPVFETLFTKFL